MKYKIVTSLRLSLNHLGLSVLGLSVLGCSSPKEIRIADKAEKPPVVTRGNFQSSLLLTGVVRYSKGVDINSPNRGWNLPIRWIVKDGTIVKKGEKVLEMDTISVLKELDGAAQRVTDARQALAQGRQDGRSNIEDKAHALRQKESALATARLDANVPKENYARRNYEDLQRTLSRTQSELKGTTAGLAAERRLSTLAIAEKKIALSKAERALNALKQKLETYIITAPTNGLVVASKNRRENRPYRVNDKTWPGQTILSIPDLESVVIEAELSDVDDGQVFPGMTVTCILDAYPELKISGKIATIGPVAQAPVSRSLRRSFAISITLDEIPPGIIHTGMSVQIEARGLPIENVLLAPRSSLRFSGGKATATMQGGEQKPIEIGACSSQQCIVTAGLVEGSKLGRRGTQ